jgi:hypothetical protein
VFQGATELSLDAKGRLAVPTRHRDALASGTGKVVLTASNLDLTPGEYRWSLCRTDTGSKSVLGEGAFIIKMPRAQ